MGHVMLFVCCPVGFLFLLGLGWGEVVQYLMLGIMFWLSCRFSLGESPGLAWFLCLLSLEGVLELEGGLHRLVFPLLMPLLFFPAL